ncbi:MAG TPA: endonuclease/exonuclease/phosphatase family protein [Solirubrobacteraceae bacterium]|jgi:endonuclease/exonuclease/phosphatase family metal-dependent hydrolase
MRLRVLTWNLLHGRSLPNAGRDLLPEFTAALEGWEWDVALLQEVPPWWPQALSERLEGQVEHRRVLTSRNSLLPLRRAIAVRWPDLIKSNGGGANAILVRDIPVVDHRTLRLCWWPERRQLQAVRLATGVWAGNLHATVGDDPGARRDAERARVAMVNWADGAPFVLGGDWNVRGLALAGLTNAGGHDVDFVFTSGLEPIGEVEVLERGPLSDHAPVRVTLGD